MVTPDIENNQYFLIQRDPKGDYIATAEEIARERGLAGFTQTLRRGAATNGERVVLLELLSLLPDSVQLRLQGDNPYLVMRVQTPRRSLSQEKLMCSCTPTGAGSGTDPRNDEDEHPTPPPTTDAE